MDRSRSCQVCDAAHRGPVLPLSLFFFLAGLLGAAGKSEHHEAQALQSRPGEAQCSAPPAPSKTVRVAEQPWDDGNQATHTAQACKPLHLLPPLICLTKKRPGTPSARARPPSSIPFSTSTMRAWACRPARLGCCPRCAPGSPPPAAPCWQGWQTGGAPTGACWWAHTWE